VDGVNGFYVARAVASTGIKAVLSGIGGDELFGGYPSFRRLPAAMRAKRAFGAILPLTIPLGRALAPRLRPRWEYFASTNGSLLEAYRVQRGFLLPRELRAIAGPALRDGGIWSPALAGLEAAETALAAPLGLESMEAGVARLESRLYLGSQLLRDTDAMSMAHGLEVRVPFVDHHLASAVWPEIGRHASLLRGKRLLVETVTPPLPAAIAERPKQGFTLPFDRWMRGDLKPVVIDGLRSLADDGWIVREAADDLWKSWTAGAVHWSRPWGLAVLGHFLRRSRGIARS